MYPVHGITTEVKDLQIPLVHKEISGEITIPGFLVHLFVCSAKIKKKGQ